MSLSAKESCRKLEEDENSVHRSMGIEKKCQSGVFGSNKIGGALMLFFNNNKKGILALKGTK